MSHSTFGIEKSIKPVNEEAAMMIYGDDEKENTEAEIEKKIGDGVGEGTDESSE